MPTEEMVARLRRALSLDQSAFEEVRDDASFTAFVAGLAAVVILVAGLGAWLYGEVVQDFTPDGYFVDTVILGSIFTIFLWLAGVAVIYTVLTRFYDETMRPDALFRVCAVGFLPFVIGALVFIPEIGFGFGFLSAAFVFYLTVFGLGAAFSVSPMHAVVATAAGFAVLGMILPLITGFDNSYVTGIFVYSLLD